MKITFSMLLLSSISFSAFADSPFKNNIEVTLGGYFPEADTSARIDSNIGKGRSVDLEDALGLDEDDSSVFTGFSYRFNERHALELSYFDLDRNADKYISKDITLGDKTYTLGTNVSTTFDYNVYRAGYVYSPFTTKDYSLGLALGLHVTKIELGVETSLGLKSELSESTIPLPVIGLRGSWRFADNWIANSKVDGFALSYDDYKGYLLNLGASVEYDRFKHVSIGAGWNYYDINIEVDKKNFDGEINYEYTGPTIYLKGRF